VDSDPKFVREKVAACRELCNEFQKAEAHLSDDLSMAPASDGEDQDTERSMDESPGRRWRSFNRAGSYRGALKPRIPDLSYLRADTDLSYVQRGYLAVAAAFMAAAATACLVIGVLQIGLMYRSGSFATLWGVVARHVVGGRETLLATVVVSFLLGAGLAMLRFSSKKRVCLVDFTVFKPPEDWKVDVEQLMEISCSSNIFTKKSIEFSLAVTKRSGVAPVGTYLPPAIINQEPKTMKASREEAEVVMFGCLDDLFAKTGIRPKDVGVLIVNCSLFNPTPSLTAMIVNHYKMRSDIVSYNLSGMGCSAGLIAISLAQELLQVHKNTYAVVVSTENITKNFYMGNARSMMIPNMLFRVGGAAIALSNRPRDFGQAKYELTHLVRTHRGADDEAYQTVFQKEDDDETVGVFLSKGLMNVAGEVLKINMSTLGPQVLPYSEQLKFLWNIIQRKVLKKRMKAYIPDFRKAFEHFCIHAGGRGVIDALEENLKLTKEDVLPSRHALKYYGNTSSASIWYELAWSETFPSIQRGERVWQIGFGSGFKCNSAVWRALRDVDDQHDAWLAVSKDLPRKSRKAKRS